MKTAEEARFWHAAIVGLSQDAIISKNLDAVIVGWNAGAERIFGYTEAEAVGQPITILIPPELRDTSDHLKPNSKNRPEADCKLIDPIRSGSSTGTWVIAA